MGLFGWLSKSAGKNPDGLLAEARSLAAAGRYRDALSVYSRLKRHERTPAVLVEMAWAYLADGNDSSAVSCASDALDLDPNCSAARCIQGEVLLHERKRSDALAWFREALRLDPTCDTARRRIEELAPTRAPVGPAAPTIRLSLDEDMVRNRLAEIGDEAARLRAAGHYKEAIPHAVQAVQFALGNLGPDHPDVATGLNNLALLLQATNRLSEAEPLMRRALAIGERSLGPDHPDVAAGLNNLAALLGDTNRLSEAEPLYRRALAIGERSLGPDHPTLAAGLNNLALLLRDTNRLSEAEPLMRRAVAVTEAGLGPDHPDVATCLNSLAELYVQTDRAAQAVPLMKQAATSDDRMIGQVFSIVSDAQRTEYLDRIRWKLDAFLSLVWLHLGDATGAVRDALDLVLRRKALGAEALAAQRDTVLGGKYPHLQIPLNELATLARQIARTTLAGPGPVGVQAYHQQLAGWNSRKERLEADLARQIPEMNLERRLRATDRRAVALGLPEGVALVEFVRFDVLDFHAAPGRGEPRWGDARYLAFVLPAGEPDNVRMVDLGEAGRIDLMIAGARASITGEAETFYGLDPDNFSEEVREAMRLGQEGTMLRAAVFDPLREALGGRTRLFLAPESGLARLPFEVLPTADDRRLIDEYQISYLGTGRDVLRFGAAVSGRPAAPVVVADPDFDLGDETPMLATAGSERGRRSRELGRGGVRFQPLPATRVEGERVATMLGVAPWLDRGALEQRLKGCRSPLILHLATHGFFLKDQPHDPNQERRGLGAEGWLAGEGMGRLSGPPPENPLLRSGLALAGANTWLKHGTPPEEAEDGLLTAEDVTGLDLLATELVVLSACETGLGQVRVGEGVFGLRRAFVVAGAKTLVMSLWKVPDLATAILMERFYDNLLDHRLARDVALREAQGFLRGLTVGAMRGRWLTPEMIGRLSAGGDAARRELERLASQPDDHRPFTHPLYWGAFILQGDPAPLRNESSPCAGDLGTGQAIGETQSVGG
jgi:CHAT domain-containing protein/tetratricopeptide (TPR) repeat protein